MTFQIDTEFKYDKEQSLLTFMLRHPNELWEEERTIFGAFVFCAKSYIVS